MLCCWIPRQLAIRPHSSFPRHARPGIKEGFWCSRPKKIPPACSCPYAPAPPAYSGSTARWIVSRERSGKSRREKPGSTWQSSNFWPAPLRNAENRNLHSLLTKREQQVLEGVLDGLTNKAIAGQVGISEGAAKAVLREIFRKAGVRRRSQLVRVALTGSSGTATK